MKYIQLCMDYSESTASPNGKWFPNLDGTSPVTASDQKLASRAPKRHVCTVLASKSQTCTQHGTCSSSIGISEGFLRILHQLHDPFITIQGLWYESYDLQCLVDQQNPTVLGPAQTTSTCHGFNSRKLLISSCDCASRNGEPLIQFLMIRHCFGLIHVHPHNMYI
jgi:hypothetical protein